MKVLGWDWQTCNEASLWSSGGGRGFLLSWLRQAVGELLCLNGAWDM